MRTLVLLDPLDPTQDPSHARALERALPPGGRALACPDAETLERAVDEALGGGWEVVGIAGGDAGFSAGLSALLDRGPLPGGLALLPLGGGAGLNLLQRELGVDGGPAEVLGRLTASTRRGGLGLLRPRLRPAARRCLRVVCADHARPGFGFTFGQGALYTVLDEARRGGGGARRGIRAALSSVTRGIFTSDGAWEPIKARVAVDRAPLADSMRMLLASTLTTLPMGLRPFDAPVEQAEAFHLMWHDMGAAQTAAMAVPLSLGKVDNAQHRVLQARRLDVDAPAGFVLDGQLHPASGARIVSVRPGPVVPLVSI